MEALTWLAWTMILLHNRALIVVSSLDYMVIFYNDKCPILVWLIADNWSIVDIDIFLAVFISKIGASGGVGILLW